MAKLGNLFISLFADTAQFSSGLNKAKADLNSTSAIINRGLASIDKGFTGLGRGIKGVAGELFSVRGALTALVGTVGIGSIIEMGKQAVEAVGGLGELASQIGVTTDTLQTFRYAATQVGVSQEEMDGSLSKLTKTIGLAATGNKAAIDSFNQFGIKVLDANGNVRSTDAVVRDMADAMARLPDPAQRAALATELMGKAGQKMVPFLQDGAGGIDALVKSAKELGLVFDEETIRRADDAADKLATLSLVLKTNFQAALVELAPFLSQFATEMLSVSKAVNQFFDDIRPDDDKSLDALERKFQKLTDQQDQLIADRDALQARKSNRSLMDDIFGTDIDADIKKKETQIAGLEVDLQNLQMRIDRGMLTKGQQSLDSGVQGMIDANSGLFGGGNRNPTPPKTGKSDAEKEVDAALKKLQQTRDQVAEIGKTGADLELTKALEGLNLQNPGVAALVEQFRAAAKAITDDKIATEQLDQAWDKAKEAMAAFNAEQQKGAQIAESVRTPQEAFASRQAELNELLADGALDGIDYGRAVEAAKKQLDDAGKSTDGLNSAMASLGATWSSAFEDAALAMDDAGFSAKSLGNLIKGLAQDVERLILRMTVTDPIAKGISGIDWSSMFSGLFGGAPTGHQAAISSGSTGSSGGGFFDWISSLFHTGGIAGGSAASRRVPSFAFAGAPRLHGGGFIGPGEVPAILKRGEGVFTAEQMASMAPAGGGGDVIVNVTTPPGGSAETTKSAGSNGQKQIDIMVLDSVTRLSGRGQLDKPLGVNYGIKRQPGRSG